MRARALLPLLAAVALLLPAGHVAAEVPTACGGTWSTPEAWCEIAFNGGPITVYAIADAAGSAATGVSVTLEGPKVYPECGVELCGAILLGCAEAHTDGLKGCEQSIDPPLPIPTGTVLLCRVRGLTTGSYKCTSGPQP